MFGKNKNDDNAEILVEIKRLSKTVAQLKGERDAIREDIDLADQIKLLKEELTDLEISKDKVEESNDRAIREVEHKVGLEKKRQEVEFEQAKKEAKLEAKEEALESDRERFENQMDFYETQFTKQVDMLKDIQTDLMERLPRVTWDAETPVSNGDTPKSKKKAKA